MPTKISPLERDIDAREQTAGRKGHKLSWRVVDTDYATCYCTLCDEDGDSDNVDRLKTPCTGGRS